jgi:hypothetical protein
MPVTLRASVGGRAADAAEPVILAHFDQANPQCKENRGINGDIRRTARIDPKVSQLIVDLDVRLVRYETDEPTRCTRTCSTRP